MGSADGAFDRALAEKIKGLYEADVIHRRASWKIKESVELATLQWVAWFEHHRLFEQIENIPSRGHLLSLTECRVRLGLTYTKESPEIPERFSVPDPEVSMQASCAKMFTTEMVGRVADRGLQVHGGAGYINEYKVERFYRDVRLLRLYEGTTQIRQMVIGKHLMREA